MATDGRVVVTGPFTVAVGSNMAQGAAYVFVEPAGGWASETQTQRLVAGDGAARDGLGQTVAISNGTAFASAPGADAPHDPRHGVHLRLRLLPNSTGICSAPATSDGSNGWFRHPVNVTTSASDLASTVTAIRLRA